MSTDGTAVVFRNASGGVNLTIPLYSKTSITSTTNGDQLTKLYETPMISDDGSHVGIFTTSVSGLVAEMEGTATSTFRYYDNTGQLWQINVPAGSAFLNGIYLMTRTITPDGSRVLLISTEEAGMNPVINLYGRDGTLIFKSPSGAFMDFYGAQLSPNGQFILMSGTVKNNSNLNQDILRVYDTATSLTYDVSFNNVSVGEPSISITSDGRFQIGYLGNQQILPP